MSNNPAPNKNVPQVPQPLADVGSLVHVTQQLKQGVDSLAGNRGKSTDRAVTFNDLLALGVIANTGTVSGSSSGVIASYPPSVTTVVAGAGLAGGTITSTGTISLGAIAASSLLGNPNVGVAVPVAITIGTGLALSAGGTLSSTVVATGLTHPQVMARADFWS